MDHPDPTATLDAMATAWTSGPIHVNCPFAEPLYSADGRLRHWLLVHGRAPKGPGVTTPSASMLTQPVAEHASTLVDPENASCCSAAPNRTPCLDALDTWVATRSLVRRRATSRMGAVTPTRSSPDRWMRRWTAAQIRRRMDRPDLVIGFGAPILSKSLRNQLRKAAVAPHPHRPGGRAPRF